MIVLIKFISSESVVGEYVAEDYVKHTMTLRRPLRYHCYNENMSVYEPSMISLLKYDFICDTEKVEFNKAHMISITKLFDEAVGWYNTIATFIYDKEIEATKKSLMWMNEKSIEYQKKFAEFVAQAEADAKANKEGEPANTVTSADDPDWAKKVDTKIQN